MIINDLNPELLFNSLPYNLILFNNKLDISHNNKKIKFLSQKTDTVNINNLFNDSNIALINTSIKKIQNNQIANNFIVKELFSSEYLYLEIYIFNYNNNSYAMLVKDITIDYKKNMIQKCYYSISEAIYQADDLDTLYKEIHFAVSEITNTKNFYISIVDWANDKIEFPYFIDKHDKPPKPRKFKKGLTEYVIQTGTSVLLNESTYDMFIKKHKINVEGKKCFNWLGVPLKLNNNKTIGMIGIQSYNDSNTFKKEDLRALNLLSCQISTAIKRKKDDIFIHKQAHYDALTGLTNKSLFYDRLDHAILQAERHDESIAVLFLDIDDFKRINDTMGHSAGDKLLKIVGDIIKNSVRKSDTVARWGGDEFCFLLPSIKNNEGIFKLCDRILNKSFKHIKLLNKLIEINASIGISLYPVDGIKAEVLIDNADKAMYKSKQKGKNQYRMFSSK